MPASSWNQKRAAVAAALQGGGGGSTLPGLGGALQNIGRGIGAGWQANPMMRWGQQGQAAPEMAGGAGLMGQSGGGGQMARMAQMPGFNYVPPATGPAPVPQQAGMAGAGGVPLSQWNRADRLGLLTGRQTMNNRNAFNSMQGQSAYGGAMQGGGGRGLDAGRSGNTSGGISGWGGWGGWGGWDGREGYGQSSSGRSGII